MCLENYNLSFTAHLNDLLEFEGSSTLGVLFQNQDLMNLADSAFLLIVTIKI